MNVATFIGRIGRDAVVRSTTNGKSVTGWALAVDSGYGDSKQTIWVDCSWWGDRGTKVADYIRKGDRLGVSGELGLREHNGKTIATLNISNVTLLGEKREAPAPLQAPRPAQAPVDKFEDDAIPF